MICKFIRHVIRRNSTVMVFATLYSPTCYPTVNHIHLLHTSRLDRCLTIVDECKYRQGGVMNDIRMLFPGGAKL